MAYRFYVYDSNGQPIPVRIRKANLSDYRATKSNWQTEWTTAYIQDPRFDKYAMVNEDNGELIGLCAYMPNPKMRCANMMYMEAAPNSNPTLVKEGAKKYHEIGKAFFAFGVLYSLEHGGDGSLFFKAKTTELLYYYEKAFGARVLRHNSYDMFLFDKAALTLLRDFETEEE